MFDDARQKENDHRSFSRVHLAPRVRRPLRRWSGFALSALLLLAPLGTARAAESAVQTRTAARDLAIQGAEAFEAKDYKVALDRFERASALYAAPSIAIMQARTLVKLDRWVEALDKYTAIALTALPADAPEAFRRARGDAASEADALRARTPRLEIQVGGETKELVVKLDGNTLPNALLNVQQPVDPGAHVVTVEAEGRPPFQRTVKLSASQQATVKLPEGHDNASPPPASQEQAKAQAVPSRRVWTYVAFGVGGLGLTIGGISGIMALDAQSDATTKCPRCTNDSGSFNRTLAFTGLAVGAAGIGVGTYLYFSEKSEPQQLTARISPAGVDLALAF